MKPEQIQKDHRYWIQHVMYGSPIEGLCTMVLDGRARIEIERGLVHMTTRTIGPGAAIWCAFGDISEVVEINEEGVRI
jgi:hypothetical protein